MKGLWASRCTGLELSATLLLPADHRRTITSRLPCGLSRFMRTYWSCSFPSGGGAALSSRQPAAATRRQTTSPQWLVGDTCTGRRGACSAASRQIGNSPASARHPCLKHMGSAPAGFYLSDAEKHQSTHRSMLSNARYSSIRPSTSNTLPGGTSTEEGGTSVAPLPCTFSLSHTMAAQHGETSSHEHSGRCFQTHTETRLQRFTGVFNNH